MKNKQKILYTGENTEITWAAMAYIGPSFIIPLASRNKTPFIVAHSLRAGFMFFLCLLSVIPMIILKHTIDLSSQMFLFKTIRMISLLLSTTLLIEYISTIFDTINGKYKTKFFISKISESFISKYIYEEFMQKK